MRLRFGLDRLARPAEPPQPESDSPEAKHLDAREDRARAHNWTGYHLLRLALESPELDAEEIFCDAVHHFEDASAALPKWSVPLENCADTWSYLGELRRDPSLQTKAIALYEEAAKALTDPEGGLPSKRKDPQDKQADPAANALIKREADAANAHALKELSQSIAICKLLRAPRMPTADVHSLVATELGTAWDPNAETNGDVLYTAACLFARAGAITEDDVLRANAIRALGHAFYVDHELTDEADGDPDLASIRVAVDALRALDWKTLAAQPGSRAKRLVELLAGYV